jgi:hypothetical protein
MNNPVVSSITRYRDIAASFGTGPDERTHRSRIEERSKEIVPDAHQRQESVSGPKISTISIA